MTMLDNDVAYIRYAMSDYTKNDLYIQIWVFTQSSVYHRLWWKSRTYGTGKENA